MWGYVYEEFLTSLYFARTQEFTKGMYDVGTNLTHNTVDFYLTIIEASQANYTL